MTATLFSPLALGPYELAHRVIMAPLTRMRASQPGNIPSAMNVDYYAQRASLGGLIISEGSQISPSGQGMPATPGIHTPEQIAGWKAVTEAVHAKRGRIFSAALACRPHLPFIASARWRPADRALGDRRFGECFHGVVRARALRNAASN